MTLLSCLHFSTHLLHSDETPNIVHLGTAKLQTYETRKLSASHIEIYLLWFREKSFRWGIKCRVHGYESSIKNDLFYPGGADHNVRLVSSDLTQNPHEAVRVLRGHRDYVNSLAFHPGDGSQVLQNLEYRAYANLRLPNIHLGYSFL